MLKGPSGCNKSSTIRLKQAQVLKKNVERVGPLGLSDAYVSVWPVERAVKTNPQVWQYSVMGFCIRLTEDSQGLHYYSLSELEIHRPLNMSQVRIRTLIENESKGVGLG